MNASVYTSPILSTVATKANPSNMTLNGEPKNNFGGKRCGHAECKKKLGLLGFDCKCGAKFCASHRYPSDHSCSFDFKAAAAETLKTQLASCVAEKVTRI